ncbi:MAG TPA: hypothetical protein VGG46_10025 [Terriglobales bacterium]|jgi:hypothetical protein
MKPHWEEILKDRLQLYGHRNWFVIADSAYPAQSKPGIETIVSEEDQATVLDKAFAILNECKHIKPVIYTDKELSFVSEEDARGITTYREELADLVEGYEVRSMQHEEIIAKLDAVGESFQLLLIKTNMQIPYTSVFFELECGYWNAQAEDRLRAAMRSSGREAVLNVTEGVAR